MTKRSVTHATFVIERVYNAQPARVFAALSDPAEKTRWFNGPEEWGPDEYSMMREQGTAEVLDALGAYLSRELTGPEPAPATAR